MTAPNTSVNLSEVQMSAACRCGRVWHCRTLASEPPPIESLSLSQCPMCRPPSGLISSESGVVRHD